MTKSKLCNGIFFRRSDVNSSIQNQIRCLLVNKAAAPKNLAVRAYFRKFPADQKAINRTFAKRKDWTAPDKGKVPDAFLSYMNHRSPRLILNNIGANSTNTVHRIYFNDKTSDLTKLLIAISFHSTITQLSAELEGRVYGSGVLKLEPNEAVKILIVMPPRVSLKTVKLTARKIDRLSRRGKIDEATFTADEFLAKHIPRIWTRKELAELRDALRKARARRYPQLGLRPVK